MSVDSVVRDQRRLCWAIESQLVAGRDLIRCDAGVVVDRAQARAIVAGLKLANAAGGAYVGHERTEAGEWLVHVTINLGRIES